MERILITICILSLFFSCTNDDEPNQELQEENFYALTVGNSWEYRWYNYFSQAATPLSPRDITETISIIGTQEIDGNLYYKFKKIVAGNDEIPDGNPAFPYSGEYYEFYRDSLGYLINDLGQIKFINNNNTEFLLYEDETGFAQIAYAKLSEGDYEFTTEAGTFDCLEMIIRYENPAYEIPAVNRHYYANGIGLIKDEVVFLADSNGSGYQRRLESYNIQ